MAQYIRNESGTVHSVADDADILDGWDTVTEAEARAENPALFGDTTPEPVPAPETPEA